jgi:hypothetical protein
MGTKHQKFSLNLKGYSPEEREAIAVKVIDQIVKRTQSGKDKNGEPFAPYSGEYRRSQNFKIAGKGSKVDLTLSGDMLDSIRVLTNQPGKVTIGFERGTTENGKADGNIRGTYGQSASVGPKRDFLGITKEELRGILNEFPKGTDRAREKAKKVLTEVEDADRLSGRVDVEDLDD